MKNPGKNNNMFTEAKERAVEPFASFVDGSYDAAVCAVFAEGLSDDARGALEAACAGLGFADPVFLDAGRLAAQAASADVRLSAKELFAAVEALDPLMVVVVDSSAAALLTAAYREPFAPSSHGFAFGRPYAAFSSFQRDLDDSRMKQRNWALLKAMRKSAPWLE